MIFKKEDVIAGIDRVVSGRLKAENVRAGINKAMSYQEKVEFYNSFGIFFTKDGLEITWTDSEKQNK